MYHRRAIAFASLATLLCFSAPVSSTAEYGEYPVPGRLEGVTSFSHETAVPKKSNKSYPAWFRGEGAEGIADSNTQYFYTELLGPEAYVKNGLNAEHIYCGTLQLKQNAVYPAHNHPAHEFYYILDGEADWYADDLKEHVTAGSIMYHRPYTVHGWTNTSETEPLKAFWCWWVEPGETAAATLGKGARFTNPDLFESPETVKPHAVPIPEPRTSSDIKSTRQYGEYPVPGRLEGLTIFSHENEVPKKANKSYPAWFRGEGAEGIADEKAHYFYTELLGPEAYVKNGLNAEHIYCGTLQLKQNAVYPAHNHPAHEFYYILDGEADWYADDEKQHVTPGSIMYHRPYTVHGWTNTSETEPLKAFWCWWVEPGETAAATLGKGARFTNPDLFESPETVQPHAVPVPPVQKREEVFW